MPQRLKEGLIAVAAVLVAGIAIWLTAGGGTDIVLTWFRPVRIETVSATRQHAQVFMAAEKIRFSLKDVHSERVFWVVDEREVFPGGVEFEYVFTLDSNQPLGITRDHRVDSFFKSGAAYRTAETTIRTQNVNLDASKVPQSFERGRERTKLFPSHLQLGKVWLSGPQIGTFQSYERKSQGASSRPHNVLQVIPILLSTLVWFTLIHRMKSSVSSARARFMVIWCAFPPWARHLALPALALVALAGIGLQIQEYHVEPRALQPGLSKTHLDLGIAYASKGEIDRAIVEYHKAIQLQPSLAEAYLNLGIAYASRGEIDRAIVEYDKAIYLRPDLAEAFYNRGNAHYTKGRLDEAIVDYRKTLAVRPTFAEAYSNLGMVYAQVGHLNDAIHAYQQAIHLRPNLAAAHLNLGMVYSEKGDLDGAISSYSQAVALEPDRFAEAYYLRGIAYKLKGQTDNAIADFKKVLELTNDPTLGDQAKRQLGALRGLRERLESFP